MFHAYIYISSCFVIFIHKYFMEICILTPTTNVNKMDVS